MNERFPKQAHTVEEALEYYRNRARQLLSSSWRVTGTEVYEWGVHVTFTDDRVQPFTVGPVKHSVTGEVMWNRIDNVTEFHSVFVLESARNQGHLGRWMKEHPGVTFVVMEDCDAITSWLKAKGYPYRVARPYTAIEYELIARHYGNQKAKRSGVWLMNHIDEGLFILDKIDASPAAKSGYCLHPLVQLDADLKQFMADGRHVYMMQQGGTLTALVNALEYRNIANAYLSKRMINRLEDIALSPLKDVNDMLIADKIQNRKDFERYHKATHPNSKRLADYFEDWCERLGITEDFYQSVVADIDKRTTF
jgi:hypothetical protein